MYRRYEDGLAKASVTCASACASAEYGRGRGLGCTGREGKGPHQVEIALTALTLLARLLTDIEYALVLSVVIIVIVIVTVVIIHVASITIVVATVDITAVIIAVVNMIIVTIIVIIAPTAENRVCGVRVVVISFYCSASVPLRTVQGLRLHWI